MSPNERKLLRVMAGGGMLIPGDDGCEVYRTKDVRRGCVGVLSKEAFARLKDERAVTKLPEVDGRWEWRAGLRLDLPEQISPPTAKGPSPAKRTSRKRPATVLEAALIGADGPQDKARMARAAMRFLRDYELQSAGPSVTMNWSFELTRHKGGQCSGLAGLPARSLSAQAVLQQVADALGERPFALIECALIQQHSQRRLCADFGMNAGAIIDGLRQNLRHLADVYDHQVRAEA